MCLLRVEVRGGLQCSMQHGLSLCERSFEGAGQWMCE